MRNLKKQIEFLERRVCKLEQYCGLVDNEEPWEEEDPGDLVEQWHVVVHDGRKNPRPGRKKLPVLYLTVDGSGNRRWIKDDGQAWVFDSWRDVEETLEEKLPSPPKGYGEPEWESR